MHTLTFRMRHLAFSKFSRYVCKLNRRGTYRGGGRNLTQIASPVRFYVTTHLGSPLVTLQRSNNYNIVNKNIFFRKIHNRNNEQNKEISETTILLQQGLEFQEVPVAVLKSDPSSEPGGDCKSSARDPTRSYIDLNPMEEKALVDGFNSYHSPQEVLRILDTIPSHEVTPVVSFSILRKLFELESNFGFRNNGNSWIVSVDNGSLETFVRGAVIRELINKIITSNDSKLLLDTLDILRSEKNRNYHLEPAELSNYRDQLCDNIFVRIVQGKFSLKETCRAVCAFGEMQKDDGFKIDKNFIDKMWVAIVSNDVTINNIIDVFKTLEYFSQSQRLVCNVVDKKMRSLWWRMDSDNVAKICDIIRKKKLGVSGQMLMSLSRCTALNLHNVTEDQLERIIQCFHHKGFCDVSIEKALCKYMKAKCTKITSSSLIATIMDFTKKFRIRSPRILEGSINYVIDHSGTNLSPPQITSIITCLGYLDFQPTNGAVFWNIVEKLLEDKFVSFKPTDILDIFLSCLYLGKHPLNFASRIFSPYFMDRLYSSDVISVYYNEVQNVRSRLKLLDSSLHLECGWKYGNGHRLLPKDFSMRTFSVDGRIGRMVNVIKKPITELCQQHCSVETSIVLPSMPLHELYSLDVVIIPIRGTESQVYNYLRNRISLARENVNQNDKELDIMCILVNIPEHYSMDGDYLLGPQAMRIRHLKLLGFRVANIKYELIAELKNQPVALRQLLNETLLSLDCPGVELTV